MDTKFNIGDKVLVSSNRRAVLSLGEIFGETKTSWRVKFIFSGKETIALYDKRTTYLRGGGAWNQDNIREFDEEEWNIHLLKKSKYNHCHWLQKFPWEELELDDLKEIYQLAKSKRKS